MIEKDYEWIDKLVNTHFPTAKGDFYCIAEEEWNNDSEHKFLVEPKELPTDTAKRIEEGNFMYSTNDLLNKLCLDKVIKGGNYLIDVSW